MQENQFQIHQRLKAKRQNYRTSREENLGELFSDLKGSKYFYKQDTKDTKSSHKMRCFTHSTPALSYLNAGKRQVTNKGNIMGKKNF